MNKSLLVIFALIAFATAKMYLQQHDGKTYKISTYGNVGNDYYLAVNGKVGVGSWQWGYVGRKSYISSNAAYTGGDLFTI